jgi:hypothetical protein
VRFGDESWHNTRVQRGGCRSAAEHQTIQEADKIEEYVKSIAHQAATDNVAKFGITPSSQPMS